MAVFTGQLKQRIVGALVLIALAVIFLPMLFKKDEQLVEQPVQVSVPPTPIAPSQPVVDTAPVVVPQPTPPVILESPVTPPAAQPSIEPIAQPSKPVIAETTRPVAPPAKPETKPAPIPNKPVVSASAGQWAVQLARSSDEKNAKQLSEKFRAKQYKAYISKESGFYYVRIGPLVKRDDAQQMCKQLKAREQQDCFVVTYKAK
ncbi:SPOR domain-containing protein [Pseudomonas sp. F1_0610]|uniref:SPOR domain-containing protein n=1 Tax=Pseudomonas sp. F1_0610 TaxID=3114284 RepID=UPI0039C4565F